ncbi:MAG: sodium:calcium antiporter [Pyrobaculum arsenaticum]|uniref:sodium:calcium antiporter n=1 Tax=Pyrobaculum arsenaticum TaxID=121277 RepID=UPI000A96F79D|nr:sodium:calcium antiporter [Pyrobaculum arsenaticum]MCY0890362.1 sodium:calcium antiporter [Pyrobaculum arsenaticum]
MAEVSLVPSIGPAGVVAGIVLTLLAGLLIEQLVHYISWRYQRAATGVAAIFAPIITSSPELAIFTIALLRGEAHIAWGSIVAQPFMASTVIYPAVILTALVAWLFGKRRYKIPHVHRIVAVPLLVFTIPLLSILFLHPEKYGLYGQLYGVLLLGTYFLYAKFMLREEKIEKEAPSLWLRNPALQTVAALAAMVFGAEWMVSGIKELGAAAGLDKLALSVILVPIATVIPESIVGLIFIAKGKDDEGISVIVGEKALYSTFYPGLAMALGVYTLEPAAAQALIIAIIVSMFEIVAIWFGYFGLTAPIGLAGYLYYVACYTLHAACPQISW